MAHYQYVQCSVLQIKYGSLPVCTVLNTAHYQYEQCPGLQNKYGSLPVYTVFSSAE